MHKQGKVAKRRNKPKGHFADKQHIEFINNLRVIWHSIGVIVKKKSTILNMFLRGY